MSQCLWSLAISLKKQPGDNVVRIKHYVCLHFNIHFIGRKDMETSLCSLTMECGPSCNPLPLSSTRHHRQGSPLHFLDRLESCCSICWEDMQPWPESLPSCGMRESAREVTCATGEQSLHAPRLPEFTWLFRSWIYTVFWWNETERVSHGQPRPHELSSAVSCRCMSSRIKPLQVEAAQSWEITGFSHVWEFNAVQEAQGWGDTESTQGAPRLTWVRVNNWDAHEASPRSVSSGLPFC